MTDRNFSIALAYDVLGLKPGAGETEVRAARLRLVRSFHPDTYDGDRAAADRKLARINAAFDDVLQDLRSRGPAAGMEERAADPVARPAPAQRKSKVARRVMAPAPRSVKPATAPALRVQPVRVVRSHSAVKTLSEPDRRAHRAAETAFAAARRIFRGEGKPTVRLTA